MGVDRRFTAALFSVLAGCVYTPEEAPPPVAAPPVETPRVASPHVHEDKLAQYLALKRQAADSNEAQWRTLYDEAKADATLSARERRVRLTLLLGAPNRPEPDWKEAERLLDTLLKDGYASVSQPIRDLLTVAKHEIVKRGRLVERMKQLEARQDGLQTDVKRLEQELAGAMDKIQALTKIEKSIERPKNSETP